MTLKYEIVELIQKKKEAIRLYLKEKKPDTSEPELRAEFIKKIKEVQKQNTVKIDSFARRYGLSSQEWSSTYWRS